MGLEVVLAAIANFLPGTLAGYFFEKGLDRFIGTGPELQDELQEVIQQTITEYAESDNRNYGRNLPFYHSVNIVSEFLKFRVMSPEDFNYDGLMQALNAELEVTPPTEQELNNFFSLFISKIGTSESLKQLEIKETYSQEIFNISRKITELNSRIDNLALANTADLQLQWKDRVDAYVKTLQAFKPATALSLLESLEKSLTSSATKPGISFMAFLAYQKGQCLGLIGRRDEAYRAKLKAWSLDKSNTLYGQSAAISLFRMNDNTELDKILKELVFLDEYNPVYWALMVLSKVNSGVGFDTALEEVPLFVKKDLTFLRVLYNESDGNFHNQMRDRGMTPNCLEYQEQPVTIDGYNEAIFWINSSIEEIFQIYFLDYYVNNQDHHDQMKALNAMLGHFLSAVRGSEISDNFEKLEFLYVYTTFSLFGAQTDALQLEAIYARMVKKETLFAIQAANALQLTDLKARAVALLEGVAQLTSEGLLLLLFCYQKMDDMEGYRTASKKFIQSISTFEERFLLMFLNLVIELKLLGQLDFFTLEDFLSGKTYADPDQEQLITAVVALLFGVVEEHQISYVSNFVNETEDTRLVDILGSAFFAAEQYEQALQFLGKNLEGKQDGRELYQYIHAQNKTGHDYKELLNLLENWRRNSTFNAQFLRLEAQLRQELVDWPAVVEICELYLEVLADDSAMFALYVQALHKLNTPSAIEKIKGIPEKAKKVDFHRPVYVIPVSQILSLHGMKKQAFELIYPFAADPKAIDVRSAYTGLVFRETDLNDVIAEYEIVELGYFVSYLRDGKVYFVEMDENALTHAVHKQFIGKSKGDKVIVPRKMSNLSDEYIVKRIMNKYLSLFEEILNQAKDDPHAGLPFETIDIDPEHPGGILGMFEKMFGKKHLVEEKTKDADFNSYYQGTLSFSELVSSQYSQKYIQGYYGLIRYRNGINTIRRIFFAQHRLDEESQIVLDFTSLALFYQIWLINGHEFKHKFIVSKYLVELFSNDLIDLQYRSDPFGSSTVDSGKVAIDDDHFDFIKDQKTYLRGLLDWMETYCEVTLSDNTIDMIKKAGIQLGQNAVIDAAMSTLLLVTDYTNRVLVSDDSFSLKMQLLPLEKVMSAEHYLKITTPLDSPVFDEFVSNRYIKYSPTAKQLDEAYLNKLSGKYSNYDQLIENLSLVNERNNIDIGIQHLKDIALKPLLNREQLLKDLTAALIGILKDCAEAVIELFGRKIFLEFRLLGTRQDDILLAFSDAKIIISELQARSKE
jgi:hypothetical protein